MRLAGRGAACHSLNPVQCDTLAVGYDGWHNATNMAPTLDDIYKHLNRYKLYTALYRLGEFTSCFDLDFDLPLRVPNNRSDHLAPFVAEANKYHPDKVARVALAWTLYRFGRLLLLSGAGDSKWSELGFLPKDIRTPYQLLSTMYDPFAEKPLEEGNPSQAVHRLIQTQAWLQEPVGTQIARVQHQQTLFRASHLWEPTETLFKQVYGLSTIDWLFLLLVIYTYATGGFSLDLKLGVPQLDELLQPATLQELRKRNSLSKPEYCQRIRGKDDPYGSSPEQELYSFEPLWLKPFYRPDPRHLPENVLVIPNKQCLLHKIGSGLLYDALELQEDDGGKQASHTLRTEYGNSVMKQYLLEYFRHFTCGDAEVFDLDTEPDQDGRPDVMLVMGDTALLFETKLTLTNLISRYLGNRDTLLSHLRLDQPMGKGISQLQDYARRVLKGELPGVSAKHVVCFLVSHDLPAMANSWLLEVVLHEVGEKLTAPLQFASLADIEHIAVYMGAGCPVAQDLVLKCQPSEGRGQLYWPVLSFLNHTYPGTKYENSIIQKYAEQATDRWRQFTTTQP